MSSSRYFEDELDKRRARIAELKAENARLRETLKWIGEECPLERDFVVFDWYDTVRDVGNVAREALGKELPQTCSEVKE